MVRLFAMPVLWKAGEYFGEQDLFLEWWVMTQLVCAHVEFITGITDDASFLNEIPFSELRLITLTVSSQ
jgi:hypothetical protein